MPPKSRPGSAGKGGAAAAPAVDPAAQAAEQRALARDIKEGMLRACVVPAAYSTEEFLVGAVVLPEHRLKIIRLVADEVGLLHVCGMFAISAAGRPVCVLMQVLHLHTRDTAGVGAKNCARRHSPRLLRAPPGGACRTCRTHPPLATQPMPPGGLWRLCHCASWASG
jgi:hypothetical protein